MTVEILDYTPVERETLRASLAIRLTTAGISLEIRNVQLRERDGRRWIMSPVARHGGSFSTILRLPDAQQHEAFRSECLAAVDRYLEAEKQGVAA